MYIEKGFRGVKLPAAMVEYLRTLGITDNDIVEALRVRISELRSK